MDSVEAKELDADENGKAVESDEEIVEEEEEVDEVDGG